MPVITISRGSYSKGKEIAERLAQKLGYEYMSRDILIEASQEFNIPEIKLIRAIHDAPSIFERFTYGKEKYISHIRKALLEHVIQDNIVYHGLAGHFFLQGISHVLKVRIIADLQDRIKEEMKREKISAEEARHILVKDDQERKKWSLYLYGIDTSDPRLYDIVIHIANMGLDDAVDIIMHALQRPCFQKTPQSQKIMNDLVLNARVESKLIDRFPTVKASSKNGVVRINIVAPVMRQKEINIEIKELLKEYEEVKEIITQFESAISPD